jgi:hypothetical protein
MKITDFALCLINDDGGNFEPLDNDHEGYLRIVDKNG